MERGLRAMQALPEAWIRIDRVHRLPGGLRLDASVCRGRRGAVASRWSVCCRGVRELMTVDLDGGGMRFYRSDHPVARQYRDSAVTLRCGVPDLAKALGVLFAAHRAEVDDWIPFERYVKVPGGSRLGVGELRLRGPRFLMRSYARALRGLGVKVALGKPRAEARSGPRLGVLHFGNSFVVAASCGVKRVDAVEQPDEAGGAPRRLRG